jgi:beta-phosphoglucomutase-like phosphatase (HAD superfamily)
MIDENISIKAVIFDMDGTLIDSVNADFLAWQKVFADYGKSLTFQDYIPLLGIRNFSVVKEFLEPEDKEEQKKVLAKK